MVIRCNDCDHGFLNYDSWFDEEAAHPETGTTPLVLACPECGEEQKREYDDADPRQ